jgi:hypothetical protein
MAAEDTQNTPKRGVDDWHKDCDLQFRYENAKLRAWWCESHRQWCYEWPTAIILVWSDGTESRHPRHGNAQKEQ